jgi:4-amino-4-deoxychorismate lyase
MTIDIFGEIDVTIGDLGAMPNVWQVGVAEKRLVSSNPWLGVKTTERNMYNAVRAALPVGVHEMIFLNEREEVCEGTITNIFLDRDGRLLTPPLANGVLPGVLRQELLENGKAVEAQLTLSDLREGFYVGNSLRGLIKAQLS